MVSDFRQSKAVRVLHTADLHLGSYDGVAGQSGGTHDSALGVLERVVTAALDEDVHIVVIVGDLFDSNRMAGHLVKTAIDTLGALKIPIVVLPGNHDCYGPDSAYRRFDWARALPYLRLITSGAGEVLRFPELDLAIWGKAHTSHDDCRPLQGLPEPSAERWQIAVAHGHVVRCAQDPVYSYPIYPAEIAASKRDYVALGHWESMSDVSAGQVLAAHSGSPQRTGGVLIVELDGRPRYVRRPI